MVCAMNETKRQVLPSSLAPKGLWVVATPIGNLDDLSPRAKLALQSADAILCEDTRRTAGLLSALGLKTRLERMDAFASESRIDSFVARMVEGESFAYVTDAGTPAVSDPGASLVRRAREAGVTITPIPGPSAVIALLSVSGLEKTAFVFRGFFPRKQAERKAELELTLSTSVADVFIWFESPRRIADALSEIAGFFEDRPEKTSLFAGKELTKIHESFFWGTAREVADQVRDEIEREGERGEWCFLLSLEGRPKEESSDWVKALHCLLDAGVSASEAARQVSQHFGAGKKEVYEKALVATGKKR